MSGDGPRLNIVNMKHVVQLSSDAHGPCEECRDVRADDNVGNAINRYLGHGYVLRHVGMQTTHDLEGEPSHSTVAIMGLPKAAKW